jgi:acyl-CoA thioesterase
MPEFSEVMDSLVMSGADGTAAIPPDWMQGRTSFGGIAVALANRAIRTLVPDSLPLRELQVAFIGPVAAGEVDLDARLLRRGRAVAQAECSLSSGGQLATRVLGTYGAARPSRLVADLPVSPSPEAGSARPFHHVPGITPEFTRHISMRWVEGALPFGGGELPRTRILIRHDEPATLTEEHVIALADAIPPPGLSVLDRPVPASSLTWTMELLRHDFGFDPGHWWRMDAEVVAGREGYLHQTAILFDPVGRAVALNRQLVVVYDL